MYRTGNAAIAELLLGNGANIEQFGGSDDMRPLSVSVREYNSEVSKMSRDRT